MSSPPGNKKSKNRNIFQENDISSDCKLEPSHLEYWIKGKLLKVNFDPQSVVGAVLIVDMGHLSQDQVKNGHILPTGQWYAPSAVINDELIMPEYARAC